MVKKWEYLIERTTEKYNPDLKKLGLDGWELISVVTIPLINHQDYKYVFKREIK